MKRFLLIPLLLVAALQLGGCEKARDLIKAATTTVVNPVDSTDIYNAKNVYAATLTVADKWRATCEPPSYAQILADPVLRPICKDRRKVIRAILEHGPKAKQAIADAEAFISAHPTLSAADLLKAAWAALQQFQKAVPKTS